MIISRGREYLFVHIPKTGGTSMALALEDRAKADDILIGDTPKALRRKARIKGIETRGRVWKHSTLADVEELVTRNEMQDLFVFTMVRNPWDRLVSYYHWLQVQTFENPAVALAQQLDFSSFLNHEYTQNSLRANPAVRYVTDAAGTVHADLYIRLDQFAQDVKALEEHLGFDIKLPHANASKRDAAYQSYFSDADRALVAILCSDDIERFGFTF